MDKKEGHLDFAYQHQIYSEDDSHFYITGWTEVMLRRRIELDLALIDILTLALVFILLIFPVPWLRIILGFPFILFFPGYVLVAALFSRKGSLSAAARVALSLGLSIAVALFIGLILNFTPWGIGLYSLLVAVSLFVLLVSGLAWYIRRKISAEERFSLNLSLPLVGSSLRPAGKRYRGLVIILLCIILGGGGALGYVMAKPVPRETFTEFYILGMEGKAEGYPRQLQPGEEGKVIVGIVNHEYEETTYHLEVMVDGDRLYALAPIRLEPQERWEGVTGFTLQKVDDSQKVEFLLYKGTGEPEVRYLWVDVNI